MSKRKELPEKAVYVVSGGDGTSGDRIIQTALAQFPGHRVNVCLVGNVRNKRRLNAAVRRAKQDRATIVHTLVDADLRRDLIRKAREANVTQIDLIGRVIRNLTVVLGASPVGQPGRYRALHEDYFDRVDAINFAVQHDDGQALETLTDSDIIIVGPSRVGKTPLSMYLSVMGWRAANVPFVRGIPLPAELGDAEKRRVVGLTIDASRLRQIRSRRGEVMGMGRDTNYDDLTSVREEIEACRRSLRRRGHAILDVTNKPIEETAEEAVALVGERLGRS